MWAFLSRDRDIGILLLRIWLGGVFIWVHGWPKLMGGTKVWAKLGTNLEMWGITFWPKFWGFMAMFTETACVLLFIIGFLFRPACLMLSIVMTVAAASIFYGRGSFAEDLKEASHAIEVGIVFFCFLFIGPGKYSVDKQ
jgi:putative oxidoreductase